MDSKTFCGWFTRLFSNTSSFGDTFQTKGGVGVIYKEFCVREPACDPSTGGPVQEHRSGFDEGGGHKTRGQVVKISSPIPPLRSSQIGRTAYGSNGRRQAWKLRAHGRHRCLVMDYATPKHFRERPLQSCDAEHSESLPVRHVITIEDVKLAIDIEMIHTTAGR